VTWTRPDLHPASITGTQQILAARLSGRYGLYVARSAGLRRTCCSSSISTLPLRGSVADR
jgi:hypothetical protein